MMANLPACSEPIDGFPAFIRALPGDVSQYENISTIDMYNFWVPERLGDDGLDYQAGTVHFGTAVKLARDHGNSVNTLAYIIRSMRGRPIGAIEYGFIDALAQSASAGSPPYRMSRETIDGAVALTNGGLTVEMLEAGEIYGHETIKARDPWLISCQLTDLINRKLDLLAPSYLGVVCAAALNGSAN